MARLPTRMHSVKFAPNVAQSGITNSSSGCFGFMFIKKEENNKLSIRI